MVVEKGASVKDSILMHDTVIRERTSVERCIIDKYVVIGRESDIGRGDYTIANHSFPEHLNTGLTLIGKEAFIPENVTIGTNCIIHSKVEAKDFPHAANLQWRKPSKDRGWSMSARSYIYRPRRESIQARIAKYFPDKNTVLVISGGGSTDGRPFRHGFVRSQLFHPLLRPS
ncbi:MAG: hypothetical protein MZV70_09145 [Desulfobacterales bacterium]|nr:hypothetical protein [Desulfobacterales bacterium]